MSGMRTLAFHGQAGTAAIVSILIALLSIFANWKVVHEARQSRARSAFSIEPSPSIASKVQVPCGRRTVRGSLSQFALRTCGNVTLAGFPVIQQASRFPHDDRTKRCHRFTLEKRGLLRYSR